MFVGLHANFSANGCNYQVRRSRADWVAAEAPVLPWLCWVIRTLLRNSRPAWARLTD